MVFWAIWYYLHFTPGFNVGFHWSDIVRKTGKAELNSAKHRKWVVIHLETTSRVCQPLFCISCCVRQNKCFMLTFYFWDDAALSHWCIFHRKKAAQVVQRWAKNFRGAQTNQKLAFLYLANDIIQNSRRKGPEFVNEFWKVLPGAVNDAVNSKDSSVRTAIDRLVRCVLLKSDSS